MAHRRKDNLSGLPDPPLEGVDAFDDIMEVIGSPEVGRLPHPTVENGIGSAEAVADPDRPPTLDPVTTAGGTTPANAANNDEDEESELEEEEFIVEKILKKRKKVGTPGKYEYFLKWQGFGDSYNTWEPLENMDCPELLAKFEEEWAKEQNAKKNTKRKVSTPPEPIPVDNKYKNIKTYQTEKKIGFDRGLEPHRIVGAVGFGDDHKEFLMQWKGTTSADLVSVDEAKARCPQVVIRFFEERLAWYRPIPSDCDDDDDEDEDEEEEEDEEQDQHMEELEATASTHVENHNNHDDGPPELQPCVD
jgi:hypothetical protein